VPGIVYLMLSGLEELDVDGETPEPKKLHEYANGDVARHARTSAVGEIDWLAQMGPNPERELISGRPFIVIRLSKATPSGLQTLLTCNLTLYVPGFKKTKEGFTELAVVEFTNLQCCATLG
jgi:hypothetical protein